MLIRCHFMITKHMVTFILASSLGAGIIGTLLCTLLISTAARSALMLLLHGDTSILPTGGSGDGRRLPSLTTQLRHCHHLLHILVLIIIIVMIAITLLLNITIITTTITTIIIILTASVLHDPNNRRC